METRNKRQGQVALESLFCAILILLLGTTAAEAVVHPINIDLRVPSGAIFNEGQTIPVEVWLVSATSPVTEWSSADIIFAWSEGSAFKDFENEPIANLISGAFAKAPPQNGIGWSGANAGFGGIFTATGYPGTHVTTLNLIAETVGPATISVLAGDLAGDTVIWDADFATNIVGSKGSAQVLIKAYVPVPGDFDHDDDVDQADIEQFMNWATGPRILYTNPDAAEADFDGDDDVDQDDFGIFQGCYSGEDSPADPNCAN